MNKTFATGIAVAFLSMTGAGVVHALRKPPLTIPRLDYASAEHETARYGCEATPARERSLALLPAVGVAAASLVSSTAFVARRVLGFGFGVG